MGKIVKKIVKKKVSPVPESVRGLKLEHFRLQERSEFQVGRRIWFQFHYRNLTGQDVGYGSTGMAIHRWTGTEWTLHTLKHSFGGPNGRMRAKGGPGDGPFHDDNWKADQPGEFALTPYISFDPEAARKIEQLKQAAAVDELFHMAMPVYVTVRRDKPGAVNDNPPAPLFPDKFEEVEVEEVVETGDGESVPPTEPGTVMPPSPEIEVGSTDKNELTRQVIEWHAGSGVGAVRIEFSRRQGDQWLVQAVINQNLDPDSRIELIFLDEDEGSAG